MLAADTAESGFSPGMLKQGIITPVIVQPQAEKERGNEQAKYDGGIDKIHQGKQCLNLSSSANRTGRDTV